VIIVSIIHAFSDDENQSLSHCRSMKSWKEVGIPLDFGLLEMLWSSFPLTNARIDPGAFGRGSGTDSGK